MGVVRPRASTTIDHQPQDHEWYWQVVQETLTGIFGRDEHDATERIDRLRTSLSNRPLEEQILFLHEDPLRVAGRLSDADVTDDQVRRYLDQRVETGLQ